MPEVPHLSLLPPGPPAEGGEVGGDHGDVGLREGEGGGAVGHHAELDRPCWRCWAPLTPLTHCRAVTQGRSCQQIRTVSDGMFPSLTPACLLLLLYLQYQGHLLGCGRVLSLNRTRTDVTAEGFESLHRLHTDSALIVGVTEEESSFSLNSEDDHPAGQSYRAHGDDQENPGDDDDEEIFPGVLPEGVSNVVRETLVRDSAPVARTVTTALELRHGGVPSAVAGTAGEGDDVLVQVRHVGIVDRGAVRAEDPVTLRDLS